MGKNFLSNLLHAPRKDKYELEYKLAGMNDIITKLVADQRTLISAAHTAVVAVSDAVASSARKRRRSTRGPPPADAGAETVGLVPLADTGAETPEAGVEGEQ